jgi:hypothetical protein
MKRQTVVTDPAVAAILSEGQGRAAQRAMTLAQRRSARRAAKREGVTWELDRELVAIVRQIAEVLEISPAGVANRMLVDALTRYASGEIDFEDHLSPSRSPRYLWVVEVNPNGLREAISRRLADDGEN